MRHAGFAGAIARFLCAVCLSMPQVAAASAGPSEASDSSEPEAALLYAEGEDAYRLGDFDLAIEKFKAAYAASSEPQLMYNVGLSLKRRYEVSEDVADLRAAKAVLKNYLIEIEKDPEVGDKEEIRRIIETIDGQLAAAADAKASGPATTPAPTPERSQTDPGRKLKIAGIVGMSLGVGGSLAGGVLGLGLGLGAKNAGGDLANAQDASDAASCTPSDDSEVCVGLAGDISDFRDRQRLLKNLAIGLGVSLGVAGAVVTAVGAVVFVRGRKRTTGWGSKLQVAFVPTRTGIRLVGRF